MNSKMHWPTMFIKSKSSTSSRNQLPQAANSPAMRVPCSALGGKSSHNYELEMDMSQPKARSRWNPKPEQVEILEAIFSSGMVSPPREQIKRIRAQLEVFGQVADVNVFYWFQNRKTRTKRRPRLPTVQRSKYGTKTGTPSSTSPPSSSTTSVRSKTITDLSNSPPNSMHNSIRDQYCFSSAVPVSSFAGHQYDPQAVCEEMSKTSTYVQSETITDLSNCIPNSMHSNIGEQYCFPSAVPVSSFAGHQYDPQAVCEEMSKTSTSVQSETITDLSNCIPNSMHSNIGEQYSFPSAVPVSSFAGHQYDQQAVCEEMSKTSTSVQSETITDLSNCIPNSMHSNIDDQYYFTSIVPVSSFARHQYDPQAVYEEMSKKTSVQSETIMDLSNGPPSSMHSNIGEQYCFPSAVPVSSFAGSQYDLQAVCEEMSKTSTSSQSETITDLSNCSPNSMHSNIGDQYYFSAAVPVSSSAGQDYDLEIVYKEMSNYNEFSNMQAIRAAAAGGQSILTEGTGGVLEGSIINSNPLITVIINEIPTVIPSGPINFRDFFGDTILLHSSGESVLVNELGFIVLEHGAMYFSI